MKKRILIPCILAALVGALTLSMLPGSSGPAWAASSVSGSYSAKAGSGGVTTKTFVKLSSSGTLPVVVAATAVTDKVVGICELTATAGNITRYAPIGTKTTVTSGELLAVGDLLTTGTGGKAFVCDVEDASSQRIVAIALTAASGADEDVTVIVIAAWSEQRLAISTAMTFATTTKLYWRDTAIYIYSNADGSLTIAADTGVVLDTTTITLNNGATVVNGDANTVTVTEANIVLAGAAKSQTSLIIPGYKASSTDVAADALVIPVTAGVVKKTIGGDAEALTLANGTAGQLLVIVLDVDGNGDGTLTPTTAFGWATIVFADQGDQATLMYVDDPLGWVIVGATGVAAPPEITYP